MTRQTITVAIPLHRSSEWVDNVVANIRSLPDDVTRIVVSDVTCADDATERIQRAVADDPRVTVRAEPLGLDWIAHYQLLVEEADSELFMWMPHDDVFDSSWIPVLREALDRHPDAWLAFGRLVKVSADGETPCGESATFPEPGIVSPLDATRMVFRGGLWLAVRGLFRRRNVLDAGIELRGAEHTTYVDDTWVYAVALRSALVYDDRTTTRKRYHPTNTHKQMRHSRFAGPRAGIHIALRHCPRGLIGWRVRLAVVGYSMQWLQREIVRSARRWRRRLVKGLARRTARLRALRSP